MDLKDVKLIDSRTETRTGLHELTMSLNTSLTPELSLVGGKAASLIRLKQAGFSVPNGFVLTSAFFAPWVDDLKASSAWQRTRSRLEVSGSGGLREACEAAQRSTANLPFSEVQRKHLEEISTALGNRLLAVRSSSPEEDLSAASFAGLYETVLNTTPGTLEQAVRSCFESSLDERVLLYKQENGFTVEAPSIALVIQDQIASEISGVGFSINPLTNDYDEAVINATWGQGEALVSGEINPDRFVIDKVTDETIERQLGSKGGERSNEFCLDEEQLTEVTETLKAIEGLYAVPVDVEWSFANGRFHVLQARPVTAYVPLAPEMMTVPGAEPVNDFETVTIAIY